MIKDPRHHIFGALKIAFADILLDDKKVGARILSFDGVAQVVERLIMDSAIGNPRPGLLKEGRAVGQFTADLTGKHLSDILPYVSSGDGKRTENPEDYVIRKHWSGKVVLCLRRKRAEPAKDVRLIIYTRDAYLVDPDVCKDDPKAKTEKSRILALQPDYVLVWIVATATSTEMPGGTFLRNLAGANNEALLMTADEIRDQARRIVSCDETWCTVAD